jgi:1,4-alpha-glucan branching enzyme
MVGVGHRHPVGVVAANWAPLVGETRRYAEARCRFAGSMSMLAAGTPLFLMGDEVGASKPYTYDKFTEEKEDLPGLRATSGAFLFKFYQDVIAFRLGQTPLRSTNVEILATDDSSRVIAFRRWGPTGAFLVVGSLANTPYNQPHYTLSNPALAGTSWRECFNTDAAVYGGDNVGNYGNTISASGNQLSVIIPANGVVVFEQVP